MSGFALFLLPSCSCPLTVRPAIIRQPQAHLSAFMWQLLDIVNGSSRKSRLLVFRFFFFFFPFQFYYCYHSMKRTKQPKTGAVAPLLSADLRSVAILYAWVCMNVCVWFCLGWWVGLEVCVCVCSPDKPPLAPPAHVVQLRHPVVGCEASTGALLTL